MHQRNPQMSNNLITTCPHCQTRFRLQPAQLQAAAGMVRCGVCNEVFDGQQFLDQDVEQLPATPTQGTQEVFNYAPSDTHNPFTQVQQTQPGYDEEAWAAALLAKEETEDTDEFQLSLVPESLEQQPQHTARAQDENLGQQLTTTDSHADNDEPDQLQSDLFDIPDEPLQLSWQPKRSSIGKRLLLGLLLVFCLLALAGQYVYFNYQQLSRNPAIAQLLQRYCPTLGCPLPKLVDTSLLNSSNLMVRRHPDFDSALMIDAVIYNRANHAQAYPLIRLNFLDEQQQVIASRTFSPGEYLGGELAGSQSMPAQIPIRISFEVLNPSSLTQGYNLEFISPE